MWHGGIGGTFSKSIITLEFGWRDRFHKFSVADGSGRLGVK